MKTYFFLFLVLNLFLISCDEEASNIPDIRGYWRLVYGELNGKAAPGLEKIFFEFGKDSLKTNFTESESEEVATYILKEDKIIQKTGLPIVFEIENATDTLLELATALRGLDFKLVLKKDSINFTPPQ
jgi:hypothetical protein